MSTPALDRLTAAEAHSLSRSELEQLALGGGRELRIWREREQDFEERYQGPADIEGIGGRPSVIIFRDKNMAQVKRVIDDLPNIPALRAANDPTASPLGPTEAEFYVRNEVAMMINSLRLVGPYNPQLVKDNHELEMFIHNRAGLLLLDDVIGRRNRADLVGIVGRIVFARSVPHLAQMSQETEVEPVEAPRKGFG